MTDTPAIAAPAFSIGPDDGSVRIGGCSLVLAKGLAREVAAEQLSRFYRSKIDHRNGYEWLFFQGASFGAQPCGFALCFHLGHLTEIHFGVSLPDAKLEGGWPTREAIDREIAFVRRELASQCARTFQSGLEHFSWGIVWSQYDEKGGQATAGLRYALSADSAAPA
jgi:hypothetical protein